MLTIRETLDAQTLVATRKAEDLKHRPWAFIVAGLLGGAYISFGGVLMLNAAGPLVNAGDPLAKLLSGLVFSVGLVLVVIAGAELVTSTMMTTVQAVAAKALQRRRAMLVIAASLVTNFIGALIVSGLVAVSGALRTNAAAGDMLAAALDGRAGLSPIELFVRGILCNILVCLAIWMSTRVTHTTTKIIVIVCGITAFVASGYEHVVANMGFYWLGVFTGDPNASTALFATNMLWVGLGNLVGGSVIVGLGAWVMAGSPSIGTAAEQPLVKKS